MRIVMCCDAPWLQYHLTSSSDNWLALKIDTMFQRADSLALQRCLKLLEFTATFFLIYNTTDCGHAGKQLLEH